MAKKQMKVFFITDGDGILLGAVCEKNRDAFEKKCKKAGFEIVEKECCGEGDCDGCQCDNAGVIHLPKEKFVPATDEETSRFELQPGMTLMRVNFGGFTYFVPTVMVEIDDGCMFIFHEENLISL